VPCCPACVHAGLNGRLTIDRWSLTVSQHAELEFGLLLVGVGDPAGDAGVRAAAAVGGGGAGVAVAYLPAALAGDHRVHDDRSALSAAAAGEVAGADLADHSRGAGAAADGGAGASAGSGGAGVAGGVVARGAAGGKPRGFSDLSGERDRAAG